MKKVFIAMFLASTFQGMPGIGLNLVYASPVDVGFNINQQKQVIHGVVTDSHGEPLAGASVLVVGESIGTVTDAQGKFTLALPSKKVLLRVSFVGMQSKEVPYDGKKRMLNIVLQPDSELLEDVVVIGYGSKKRNSLTSSISSVSKRDLNRMSSTSSSLQDMLGGTIQGVLATQNSGEPGSALSINIRGITSPYPVMSMSANNNTPLYVIDGVPMFLDNNALNPLLNIAPGDIESIDVLKDAAATAIYGSRGANGVIIVTTKTGRKNETRSIDVNYTFTVANPVKVFSPLNNSEFKKFQLEVLQNTIRAYSEDMNEGVSSTYLTDLSTLSDYAQLDIDPETWEVRKLLGLNDAGYGNYSIDWNNEIRNRNAQTHRYNVSLRGGSQTTDYYLSLNGTNQEGLFKRDRLDSYGARLSLNTNITNSIKTGAILSYSTSQRKSSSQESIMTPDIHPWLVRPDLGVRDDIGEYVRIDNSIDYGLPVGFSTQANPVALLERKAKYMSEQIMSNVYVDIELLKSLKFHTDFTLASYNYSNRYFSPRNTIEAYANTPVLSRLETNDSKYLNTSVNFRFDYSHLYKKHLLGAMFGYGADRTKTTSHLYSYQGFPDDNYLNNSSSAQAILAADETILKSGLNSVYGRLSYDYDSRYLLELNLRADASSKFGPDNQWGFFPAVSVGWVISKEAFIEKLNMINNLKMRLSWGQTGSTNISDFSYKQFYEAGLYGKKSAVFLQNLLPNKGIHWEKTNEVNFGLDYSLFNNRLYGSVDLYYRYTSGALAPAPHILESGMSNYYDNVIDVSNKGVELSLGFVPVVSESFVWDSNINLSLNRNKIESLKNAQIDMYMQDAFIVGKPAGTMRGYKVDHIIQDINEIKQLNAKAQEAGYIQYQSGGVGDYLMKDINKDGKIDQKDRVVIVNPEPKFYGGWTNNFSYKALTLSVLMQFSYGGEAIYENLGIETARGLGVSIGRELYGNTWTPENPTAKYAKIIVAPNNLNSVMNDRFVFKSSYLRMKDLTLRYNLPTGFVRKMHIENASVSATATNLFTITGWPGLDPETVSSGVINMGSNNDPYPLSRSVSLGIKLQF